MLKKIRITLSVLFFGLITFYFLDFAEVLPNRFHVLAHWQFVPALMSLSLVILAVLIVLTLLLGRIYCSVICPMGVFQDVVNWISKKTAKKKKKRFRFSPARNVLRWAVVAVTAVAFLCGFTVVLGLLDPYSAFGRMVTNVFKPVYMAGNNLLESIFSRFGNYTFYQVDASLLSISSLVIGLVTFAVIVFLAWKHGRTWCNTMCPVGTLLGFISRFSLLKVRIDENKCTHCMICGTKCKASCIDSKNQKIDYTRCVDCFDCLGSCKEGALVYSLPSAALKKGGGRGKGVRSVGYLETPFPNSRTDHSDRRTQSDGAGPERACHRFGQEERQAADADNAAGFYQPGTLSGTLHIVSFVCK